MSDRDSFDNPTGGTVEGHGFNINWQSGPMRDAEGAPVPPSGACLEDVLLACRLRLEHFQNSKFRCRENALAITKIDEALHWLNHRTVDRERRGVEGTYQR